MAMKAVIDEAERQDTLDVVVDVCADGPRLKVNGSVVRAKRLLRHVPDLRLTTADATPEPPPGLLRSAARASARERTAELLRGVMARAGVSSCDLAAALDLSARRVEEMRAGARPVALEHVLLVADRLPSVRDALLALLEARSG